MTGISRSRWAGQAGSSSPRSAAAAARPHRARRTWARRPARIIPLAQAIVLETGGPPPADTSVTFTTGEPRVIVLRHGPPENIVFAEVTFPPAAFADSGRRVQVDITPRPGVYGMDLRVSAFRSAAPASLTFKYGRYFLAVRARTVYGNDVEFERALSIGQTLAGGQLALLPSTRPASDNLRARPSSPRGLTWWPRPSQRGLRGVRQAGPFRRRHGAGYPAGRSRRRHPRHRVRQAAPRAIRFSPRVAGGG